MESQIIQQERLERARSKSLKGAKNNGGLGPDGKPGYMQPRKPPGEWASPDTREETF